jgi:hypothetical protein
MPLVEYIKVQRHTDAEIRRLLRASAREMRRVMAANPGSIRAMQVAINHNQMQMWAGVRNQTLLGIAEATEAAVKVQGLFDEDLLRAIGWDSTYWRQSLIAAAQRNLLNVESRRQIARQLSSRVYKNQALSSGKIAEIIETQIGLGGSARDIARAVSAYISPTTPGGVSYAAMRLGRTELNNAFHQTQINGYRQTPWVETVFWKLSGSHQRPDECNEYADGIHMSGGKAGQFDIGDVPDKPHPNCLCYTTAGMMKREEFVAAFKQGRFDNYIDGITGGSNVA